MVYDYTNCSRWLPVFWMEMSSLSEEHCQLMREIFSQLLTGNTYSCLPLDHWIEWIINKGLTLKAGLKGYCRMK